MRSMFFKSGLDGGLRGEPENSFVLAENTKVLISFYYLLLPLPFLSRGGQRRVKEGCMFESGVFLTI